MYEPTTQAYINILCLSLDSHYETRVNL